MALMLTILAEGPSPELVTHLGPAASALYARLLSDTAQLAGRLSAAHITVRYNSAYAAAILSALPNTVEPIAAPTGDARAVALALDAGLSSGHTTIVIGGNLPHLPLWRLRDAATYLDDEADVVIGPSDQGSWYLLGMRPSASDVLHAAPAPGASPEVLISTRLSGHSIHLLPPWFGVSTVTDLASLADTLRPMGPEVAPATRAMIEANQASRAVGG